MEASAVVAHELAHGLVSVPLASGSAPSGPNLPVWLAYAPWNQAMYVATPPSNVSVIGATNYSRFASISVGSAPFGVAVNNSSKQVFVTNSGSDNLSIISGVTQKVIASVSVGSKPLGVAYDASNGDVYVANNGSGNVTVIKASNRSVVASIRVGLNPHGIAWDPVSSEVFVADYGSNQVSVISGSPGKVVANVTVGTRPYGVAVDNRTDLVYVTNEGSNNVSVVSASSNTLNATVPVMNYGTDLQGIAYDPGHRKLWVGAGAYWAIVIDPANETVVDYVRTDPSGVAYNPADGSVCVTSTANVTYLCFTFGSYGGHPASSVTFNETGLPAGTEWSVTLNGSWGVSGEVTQQSTAPKIVFGVQRTSFSYFYQVNASHGYRTLPGSSRTGYANSTLGAPLTMNLTFATGPYAIAFDESGLASGTNWSVTLLSDIRTSTGSSITFTGLWNASYAFSASAAGYVAVSPTGNVTVAGANLTVVLGFEPGYPVYFNETGFPSGASWTVTLNGTSEASTAPSISFLVPNGTYWFVIPKEIEGTVGTYEATPSNGTVHVAGNVVRVAVLFSVAPAYRITFTETGLASGTSWWIWLAGASNNSTTSTISFTVTNGTYYYVLVANRYVSNDSPGNVTVDGGPVTVPVLFIPAPYTVTFVETGLPVGTFWTVTLNGLPRSGVDTVPFYEPNGTFRFAVAPVTGFLARPANGSVTVAGVNVTLVVTFSPPPLEYEILFNESGLASGDSWSVTLNGSSNSSTSSIIRFLERNGSYPFSVDCGSGFTASPPSGFANVSGAGVVQDISCSNTTLGLVVLTFQASGLPMGWNWSITLTGTTPGVTIVGGNPLQLWSRGGLTITFHVSTGSYDYTGGAAGYLSVDGMVAVSGPSTTTVSVQFHPGPGAASSSAWSFGLQTWAIGVGVGFIAIGAIGLFATAIRIRSRRQALGQAHVALLIEQAGKFDEAGLEDGPSPPLGPAGVM